MLRDDVDRLVAMSATDHVRHAATLLATAERTYCSEIELLRAVLHALLATAKASGAAAGPIVAANPRGSEESNLDAV